MPGLDDLRLDLPDWQLEQRDDSESLWSSPEGDALVASFFGLPPDIGEPLDDLDGLRGFYRAVVTGAGAGLVELDVVTVAGVPAVRAVFKRPQEPSGMTYLGSLTLPFEQFSFVVKVQCAEHGVTGLRETAVLSALAAAGDIELDGDGGAPAGWHQDPYDAAVVAPLMRNRAEEPAWDDRFPDHPLSRCRRALAAAQRGLTLSAAVAAAPRFTRPPA